MALAGAIAADDLLGRSVKRTTCIHANPFHTILGDIRFAEDEDWTEVKILFEQFHDVKSNDVDQFRDERVETILEPLSIRSGTLRKPHSDIIR